MKKIDCAGIICRECPLEKDSGGCYGVKFDRFIDIKNAPKVCGKCGQTIK